MISTFFIKKSCHIKKIQTTINPPLNYRLNNKKTYLLSVQFLDIITNERNSFTLKINTFQEAVRELN